jgi:parallel beta-helix repeat protein
MKAFLMYGDLIMSIFKPGRVFVFFVVFTLIFALAAPAMVYADDGTPTPTPIGTEGVDSTEPTVLTATALAADATETATPAPTEVDLSTPAVTDQPTEAASETPAATEVVDALATADEKDVVVQVLDANGQPVSLVTPQAVTTLSNPDPYIDRGGIRYGFTAADCDPIASGDQPCDHPVQAAIDFAQDGETVYIGPGTYVEQLRITGRSSLTLTVATDLGSGDAVIQTPNTMKNPLMVNGVSRYGVIEISNSSNITINGLVIDGNGNVKYYDKFDGIAMLNSSGTISNNTIKGMHDSPMGGTQHGVGIYVYNNDSTARIVNIDHNNVTDFQKNGMALSGNGLTVNVTNNTVTGQETDKIAQNGIQVSYGATGTVSNNIVSQLIFNNPSNPWNHGAAGILVYQSGSGLVVANNTVTNSDYAIAFETGNNATISGNTLTNSLYGIELYDGTALIQNNEIANNTYGIFVEDGSTAVIDKNNINSNQIGIYNQSGTYSGDGYNTTITSNTIHNNTTAGILNHIGTISGSHTLLAADNSIVGNGAGFIEEKEGQVGGVSNLNDNWWGCNTGPNQTGCDSSVLTPTSYLMTGLNVSPSTIYTYGANTQATLTSFLYSSVDPSQTAITSSLIPWYTPLLKVLSTTDGGHLISDQYQAGGSAGQAQVSLSLDNAVVSALITVINNTPLEPPTPIIPVIPGGGSGTMIIPVTGAEMADLSCAVPSVLLLTNQDKVIFNGVLCGFKANLQPVDLKALPAPVSISDTVLKGMTVTIQNKDGAAQSLVPLGANETLSYLVPDEQKNNKFAVLYWDKTLKNGAGDWVELPLRPTDGTDFKVQPLHANDERTILNGVGIVKRGTEQRVEVVLNFPGTFLLVTQ